MNTQEKLEAIKAKCHELLALAEQRTQGKWRIKRIASTVVETLDERVTAACGGYASNSDGSNHITENNANATYIAACAGAAEAGWLATKEECEDLLPILRSSENMDEVDALTSYARGRAISLCVAWQEEQL
mgnify:CR=1 FL=1